MLRWRDAEVPRRKRPDRRPVGSATCEPTVRLRPTRDPACAGRQHGMQRCARTTPRPVPRNSSHTLTSSAASRGVSCATSTWRTMWRRMRSSWRWRLPRPRAGRCACGSVASSGIAPRWRGRRGGRHATPPRGTEDDCDDGCSRPRALRAPPTGPLPSPRDGRGADVRCGRRRAEPSSRCASADRR